MFLNCNKRRPGGVSCLCESRLASANLSFPYLYTNHPPATTYLATTLYASYLSTYLPTGPILHRIGYEGETQ
jgi:hypothetical protein